ncbi:MAG: M28 family peptidase [Bacteroidetes bacterium]|nr:M28 family peptidase [Bacteroidota bacterium]
MRRIIFLFLAILFFYSARVSAQNLAHAKELMDTLCSPYLGGRGYVNSGAKRASQLIMNYFKARKMEKLPHTFNYYQFYSFPVNAFPGKLSFSVDGNLQKPGIDFLVDASSSSLSESEFPLIYIDSNALNTLPQMPKGSYAVFLDTKGLSDSLRDALEESPIVNSSALIIVPKDRLVWRICKQVSKIPRLEVLRKNFLLSAKKVKAEIENKYYKSFASRNVMAVIPGTKQPDSFIILSAHYDHLGRMGQATYFPGANDNASGVAMLLDLADFYSHPENTPAYSIIFIAFSGEEAGLMGSKYFTEHPVVPLNKIALLINMDLMANGQDGMTVVNGSIYKKDYEKLVTLNFEKKYLRKINPRGKAPNSDHYWFSEKGVKSFFFYLLGDYPHYHEINDTPDKPTFAAYNSTFKLIRDYIKLTTNHR